MTKEQYRICKIIDKYKDLDLIVEKADCEDEVELQDKLGSCLIPDQPEDGEDKYTVVMPDELREKFEQYKRELNRETRERITLMISILALIVSILAIIISVYTATL